MCTLDSLQSIFPVERLNAVGLHSASVAISEDGKISSHMFSSASNYNTDTVYQCCSISKAITALAVAKLIDNGCFAYHTPVAKHLPKTVVESLVEPSTAHLIEHVTVGMLLSHTSGVSQGGFPGYAGEPPPVEDVIAGKPPSNTPKIRFLTFPGAQYKYSGGGFILLQIFLERVIGTPFEEIIRSTVLDPLGMSRSFFELQPGDENYATAHYTAHTATNAPYHRFVERAAAGLWTTPTDLLKAVSAIQDSLHSMSGFVKQQTARAMLTCVPLDSELAGMALGWAADDSVFAHAGGNDPGYTCYAFGFHGGVVNQPSTAKYASNTAHLRKSGVVVMTNAIFVVGQENIHKIVSAIFYLKAWKPLEKLPGGFGRFDDHAPAAAHQRQVKDDTWRKWIGSWERGWKLLDEGGPRLAFEGYPAMELTVAAAPVSNGEHMFVVDGLMLGLCLKVKDGEEVVVLIQNEVKELKRA